MKKLILSSILSCIALPALAGTANIPGWHVDTQNRSCFTVSNTSGAPADVTVHLYNYNGAEFTRKPTSFRYITAFGEPYTLPALATSLFCIPSGQVAQGFGTIEAHTADGYSGQVKLVAHGWYSTGSSGFAIPVNNGLPF